VLKDICQTHVFHVVNIFNHCRNFNILGFAARGHIGSLHDRLRDIHPASVAVLRLSPVRRAGVRLSQKVSFESCICDAGFQHTGRPRPLRDKHNERRHVRRPGAVSVSAGIAWDSGDGVRDFWVNQTGRAVSVYKEYQKSGINPRFHKKERANAVRPCE